MSITTRLGRFVACVTTLCLLGACDVETFDEESSKFEGNAMPPAGSPPPPAPPPPPPPPPPPAGFAATFSEIQSNVFTPSCATSGCHDAGAAASLNLSSGASYAMLVGIASSQQPGIQRVAPGTPNDSYLIQKLEGTAASGQRMPVGGALSQPVIDVVRQWITDGATDNTATATIGAIQVTALSPQPDAVLDSAPGKIVAGFSRELDASSVNSYTFILERSGGDGSFGEGNEVQIVPASVTVPLANPRSAVLDLAGVGLVDDTYRITMSSGNVSILMDITANALDGEFGSTFPTGDGTSGGAFHAEFTLSRP